MEGIIDTGECASDSFAHVHTYTNKTRALDACICSRSYLESADPPSCHRVSYRWNLLSPLIQRSCRLAINSNKSVVVIDEFAL